MNIPTPLILLFLAAVLVGLVTAAMVVGAVLCLLTHQRWSFGQAALDVLTTFAASLLAIAVCLWFPALRRHSVWPLLLPSVVLGIAARYLLAALRHSRESRP